MTRPLLPQHSRYEFVPLPERRDYSWPGGKRLAFVITTNVEWFAFGAGLGHDPAKTGEPQTHRNYSWRDYGNRIGIWRLLELFDELKLPAAHNTNSLLGQAGFVAGKTGSTDAAGGCLAFRVVRGGRVLDGVVLGQRGRPLIDAGLRAAAALAQQAFAA